MLLFVNNFELKLTKLTQLTFTCSKSTIATLEKSLKYVQSSGVFIVNFEHISHLYLVFRVSII